MAHLEKQLNDIKSKKYFKDVPIRMTKHKINFKTFEAVGQAAGGLAA